MAQEYLTQDKKKITATRLTAMKGGEKIAMVTCYDYTSALIVDSSGVDAILVGDSASNTMLGNETTLPITLDEMIVFVRSVVRGTKRALVVADMPFGTVHGDPFTALSNAIKMMKETGADAIKVEGGETVLESLNLIIEAGIPVVGHLGLTPQSVHKLGGYGVQGRTEEAAALLIHEAQKLESVGCVALVLEKIPAQLAKKVTDTLTIPTIGIGAGPDTDGQVLVFQDMLGITPGFRPKFLRHFGELGSAMREAMIGYVEAVKGGTFPSLEESY